MNGIGAVRVLGCVLALLLAAAIFSWLTRRR